MATREELTDLLQKWRDGSVEELEVWQWGQTAREAGAHEDELVADIVDNLAALPYDMIVREDVDVMLDALANPSDETDLSINLLWNHIDGLDVDGRRQALSDHPFYGEFRDAD